MAEEKDDKKLEKTMLTLFVIVFGVIAVYFFAWGFISETGGPIINPLYDMFTGTKDILSGEKEIFSLESEYEEKEKSGIELSELKTYGLESGEEFGVSVDVITYKFDERIRKVDGRAECYLYSDVEKIPGRIESDHKIGEDNFEIKNPEGGEGKIKIDCAFDNKDLIKKGTIKFDFIYSIPFLETYLDVFVLNEGFEFYFGEDFAFYEFAGRKYADYNSDIASRMKYESDVEAKIGFMDQPLALNKEPTLKFQFKNKDIKNKVDIKEFEIMLPNGMEFIGCKYLDNGRKLLPKYFNATNNQLNTDDGETDSFKCKVELNSKVLGGVGDEIVKVPDIVGKLEYDYILKKKVDIELK